MTLHIANTRNNNATNTALIRDLTPTNANNKAVTQLALDCFQDIQTQRPGVLHYTGKVACGTAAAVGTFALPVVAITAGTQYLYNNPQTVVQAIYNNPKLSIGAAATLFFGGKRTGARKMMDLMIVAATTYAVTKTVGAATSWAKTKEEQFKALEDSQHQTIKDNLSEVYDGIAEHLSNQLDSAESSLEILKLKVEAEEISSKLPLAERAMKRVGLASSEASEVMDELKGTLRDILDTDVAFNPEESGRDNTDLLIEVPADQTHHVAIPAEARQQLQRAADHTLGSAFSATKYLATAATGVASTIAVPVIAGIGAYSADYLSESPTWNRQVDQTSLCLQGYGCTESATSTVTIVGAAALLTGYHAAKYVYDNYTAEQDEKAHIVEINRKRAISTLANTYGKMAEAAKDKMDSEKAIVRNKIPDVRKEMSHVGLTTDDQNVILERFEEAFAPVTA